MNLKTKKIINFLIFFLSNFSIGQINCSSFLLMVSRFSEQVDRLNVSSAKRARYMARAVDGAYEGAAEGRVNDSLAKDNADFSQEDTLVLEGFIDNYGVGLSLHGTKPGKKVKIDLDRAKNKLRSNYIYQEHDRLLNLQELPMHKYTEEDILFIERLYRRYSRNAEWQVDDQIIENDHEIVNNLFMKINRVRSLDLSGAEIAPLVKKYISSVKNSMKKYRLMAHLVSSLENPRQLAKLTSFAYLHVYKFNLDGKSMRIVINTELSGKAVFMGTHEQYNKWYTAVRKTMPKNGKRR